MAEPVRTLKEEERSLPYAKYCWRSPGEPPAEILRSIGEGPKDAGFALPSQEQNAAGYCKLPDKGVYAALAMLLPGVTSEMLTWWDGWYPLVPLRYVLWNPATHHSVAICNEDRERLCNPLIPAVFKQRGQLQYAVEVRNGEMTERLIRFIDPALMGLSAIESEAECDYICGGWESAQNRSMLYAPNGFPIRHYSVFARTGKDTAEGLQLTIRLWLGYMYRSGKAFYCLPPQIELPVQIGAEEIRRAAGDYASLAEILPELFAEYGG